MAVLLIQRSLLRCVCARLELQYGACNRRACALARFRALLSFVFLLSPHIRKGRGEGGINEKSKKIFKRKKMKDAFLSGLQQKDRRGKSSMFLSFHRARRTRSTRWRQPAASSPTSRSDISQASRASYPARSRRLSHNKRVY